MVVETRETFAGTLWAEMTKHQRKEQTWNRIHHTLVAGSIIGNVLGTVAALSKVFADHPAVLGLLIALPTIAFVADKGFSVTSFVRWHQQAGDAYSDLRDDFYYDQLSVKEGRARKRALDKILRAGQPAVKPIADALPERDHAPPPRSPALPDTSSDSYT